MGKQAEGKLNWLERRIPEGLLVDTAWLNRHHYSTALRAKYVASGKLERPTRGVYRRPRGSLNWQPIVISLQTIMHRPMIVGGRTALDLHGYTHYLPAKTLEVHLYGDKAPPNWLKKLRLEARFLSHNSRRLFRAPLTPSFEALHLDLEKGLSAESISTGDSLTVQRWGQWEWPLVLSTPERALLELLDELPKRESFHQVDMLLEGLTSLNPRRLQNLLVDCKSIKVKRLFFFFANRHSHAWLKKLDKDQVDFGKGKRMLVKDGKLDPLYLITVPKDLNGVR
jgi:hypothetical protein